MTMQMTSERQRRARNFNLGPKIKSSAIEAFLNRPRNDYRKWKELSDDELERRVRTLPVRPPIWDKLMKHQKVCFLLGVKTQRLLILADTGCLAGETLLETSEGPVRIDKLARQGQSIMVWSNTKTGLRLVPASCPFRLGPTALYEVVFKSGRRITVTARHRFLTQQGWLTFSDAATIHAALPIFSSGSQRCGHNDHLLASVGNLSLSTLVPCHSEYQQDDLRSSYREPDYLGDYCQCCHRYDALPLEEVGNDLTFLPSQDDVQASNHPYAHEGGLVLEQSSTRRGPAVAVLKYHPSKIHCEIQGNLYSTGSKYHDDGSLIEYLGDLHHTSLPVHANANPRQQVFEVLGKNKFEQREFHQHDNPSAFATSYYDTITSVTYKRHDVYYDLHVPIHENYIAHGLCHHNTGKTLLSIALAKYFAKTGAAKQILVLVPRVVNKWEWKREVLKHAPKTSYCILDGSTKVKYEQLDINKNALIVVETYAGFMRMVCKLVPRTRGEGERLKPDKKLVKAMQDRFQGLILDEITECGNHQALPYRICRQLGKSAQAMFGLTGTPFGRDPTPIWAEMNLIDGGETLGETLGLFRAAFFNARPGWSGFPEYVFDRNKEQLLHRLLANRSIRYEADKADLPRVVGIKKYVDLPEDADNYYQRARQMIQESRGQQVTIQNAFLRMRQISSGFIGYSDDETGAKAEYEFDENPKLDMLMGIVQSIRPDKKVVIFNEFTYSGNRICKELKEAGISNLRIYGGTKDPQEALDRFSNGSERVLVLATRMVFGLNLQMANYALYFESPVSPIMRKQGDRRVIRQHSEFKKVFVYDLLVRGTVDERIIQFHRQGDNLFNAIVEGRVKL